MSKRLISNPFWWLGLLLATGVGVGCYFLLAKPTTQNDGSQQTSQQTPAQTNTETETTQTPSQTLPTKWPIEIGKADVDTLTVVVNKKHKLPSSYVPELKSVAGGQMRPEAADALVRLLNDAKASKVEMKVISAYRSYSNQVSTYNKWVQQSGQAEADRFSARPGHSEHQTGLAVDLGDANGSCDLEVCFGDSAAGKWLASHASDYGFIIRYPSDKETETGYQYEPWHIRYLGVDVAQAVVKSGKTLDQYYNVEAGEY